MFIITVILSTFLMLVPFSSYTSGHEEINSNVKNPFKSPVKWAYAWPEVPLPNGTVAIFTNIPNGTNVMVQMCVNTMCFIPQKMTLIGNDTFKYVFVPGENNYPFTKDGDEIDYHILLNGISVFNGTVFVRKNNPPQFSDIFLNKTTVHIDDELNLSVNVTDDYGVYNVSCYITSPGGFEIHRMREVNTSDSNGTYYTNLSIKFQGNYFIKIMAFDNSNQSNFITTSFFVYPPEQKDKSPPRLIDAYGLLNFTNLTIKVYLQDESGVEYAKIKINSTWYPLIQVEPGVFEIELSNVTHINVNKIFIYAEDPYNNTLNESFTLKIYNITSPPNVPPHEKSEGYGGYLAAALIALGLLMGVIVTLFVKNRKWLFILLITIFALAVSFINSYPMMARDAGGNIFNGNTCWSCLGLQPHNELKGWLVNYPNGTPVHHPQWVLNLLQSKPVFIYVHQVPCTGCEIQWKDMISHGIITQDGKLTQKYAGKIDFIVLDVTYNSPTRERGMKILTMYSLGHIGTPTTIILTKKGTTIYWYSKGGVVYHQELQKVLDEAIKMYGE